MSSSLSHSGIWRKKMDTWARWMQFSVSRTRMRNLCCSDLLFDICFISPGLEWWWHSLRRSRKSSALSLRYSTIHHATRRKGGHSVRARTVQQTSAMHFSLTQSALQVFWKWDELEQPFCYSLHSQKKAAPGQER